MISGVLSFQAMRRLPSNPNLQICRAGDHVETDLDVARFEMAMNYGLWECQAKEVQELTDVG